MRTFKQYVFEATTDIRAIPRNDKVKLDKAIGLPYTLGKSNRATTIIIVRGPKDDRKKMKTALEARLKKARIEYTAVRGGGSTGSTEVPFGNATVTCSYIQYHGSQTLLL